MSEENLIYVLDVSNPKVLAQKYSIERELSFGSSRDCDIPITGLSLAPIEGKFRYQNHILTYIQMTDGEQIRIGNQICKKGRMYILEKGDRISTKKGEKEDKLKIIIRLEELHGDDSDEEDEGEEYGDGAYDDDPTDPATVNPSSTAVFDLNEVTNVFKNPNQKDVKRLFTKITDFCSEKYYDIIDYIKDFKFRKKKTPEERIKDKLQSTKRPHHLKSKKGEIPPPAAGILPRFLGMFYNLIFFTIFYFQLFPTLEELSGIKSLELSNDILPLLKPIHDAIPAKVDAIPYSELVLPGIKEALTSEGRFNLIFLFIVYELVTHFVLGLGLGQFILGLRAKGKFFMLRLLSPLRLFIYALSAPLLIFDLPIIMNKRSLKEKLTMVSIQSKSLKSIFLNALVTFPLIVILACNYELILTLTLGHPQVTKEVSQVGRKVNKNLGEKTTFKVNLPSYGLNSNINLKLNEIIIPTIVSESSNHSLRMIFYRPGSGGTLEATSSRILIPKEDIFSLLKQDPNNLSALSSETNALLPDVDQAIMEKLYEILTINVNDPLPSFEKVMFISNPYQKGVNQILKSVGLSSTDKSALFIGPMDTFMTIEKSRADYQLSLLNLTDKGVVETKFRFPPKLRKEAIELIKDLWVPANPNMNKAPTIELVGKLAADQNPALILGSFSSLAALNKILNTESLTDTDLNNLTNTFLQLSYLSLKTEDEMLSSILEEELEKIDKWLLVFDKKNTKQSLSEFRLTLLRIQKALSEKDETFFEMNN